MQDHLTKPDRLPATLAAATASRNGPAAPSGHIQKLVSVADIFPSPENDEIYGPVDRDDPAFCELVDPTTTTAHQEASAVLDAMGV